MRISKKINNKRVLLIVIYSHIEAYPPSLNALNYLAPLFDEVYILERNVKASEWEYPKNVFIVPYGKLIGADRVIGLSFSDTLKFFLGFGRAFRSLINKIKPTLILTYDPPAFALYNLFNPWINKKKSCPIWYHNHDVMHEKEVRKFSLLWLIRKLEIHYFSRAFYFSLPNKVRQSFFPIHQLQNKPVILPNYPSFNFYGKWNGSKPDGNTLRLIFQGHISESNGIENLVSILPFQVNKKKLELHLAGGIHPLFRTRLQEMAKQLNVVDQLFFYGQLQYSKLPSLTASSHVGIAIYGHNKIMVRTMSTASNKLFEYASVGLPVIVNKREDMEKEFFSQRWIHFTVFDAHSLLETLMDIDRNYKFYSFEAKNDFQDKLNFEKAFLPFIELLKNKLLSLP